MLDSNQVDQMVKDAHRAWNYSVSRLEHWGGSGPVGFPLNCLSDLACHILALAADWRELHGLPTGDASPASLEEGLP
jgi:hypothetical protein